MGRSLNAEATFLFGLPCSGKTTWYEENLKEIGDLYINADDIKFEYPDYDETVEGMYSKEAIEEAKLRVMKAIDEGQDVIMDGGGINTKYTMNLIKYAKDKGCYTRIVFVDTPYHVCIERNKHRARKVPEQLILDKEVKKMFKWYTYRNSEYIDEYVHAPYFTEKHLFFDMDGVLAAQSSLPVVNGKIDFVNSNYFRHLPVVQPVAKILLNLQAVFDKEIYILSAAPTSISMQEKLDWLEDNFPSIKKENIFFVNAGQYKSEMFSDLHKRLKLDPKETCLIEDTHHIIKSVKRDYLMHSLHVSEFLSKYNHLL